MVDDKVAVVAGTVVSEQPPRAAHGGLRRRAAPASGLRPTELFAIAIALTLAWVAFSIWVSKPWRSELEAALGPVMGWVIPIFLAYIPGLVIWFMIFTLLITRHEDLALEPPTGEWPAAATATTASIPSSPTIGSAPRQKGVFMLEI